MRSFAVGDEFHPAPGVKGFPRIMAKAFEYKLEFELEGFEQQVLSPMYVIDILRCTFEVETAKRMLELRATINQALPNARTKNGYSKKAKAPRGHRVSCPVSLSRRVDAIDHLTSLEHIHLRT